MKLNRLQFWCIIICIWIVEILIISTAGDIKNGLSTIRILLFLLTIILYVGATMLRLKDAGKSMALALVMFIFPIAIFIFGVLPTEKPHGYYANKDQSEEVSIFNR